ncbi:PD-(D/E)XK nuclease family protein [Rhodocyclaceae bacterium]
MIYLCATQRLARNLQLGQGRRATAQGLAVWPSLRATTLDAWLAELGEAIALCGEVPADEVPGRVLMADEALLVWRGVLEADAGLELFDRHSLAESAYEAHVLMTGWGLPVDPASEVEETRRFLQWRRRYLDILRSKGWADLVQYRERVFGWIERGCGRQPQRVVFAGFDAPSPQVRRLRHLLTTRGVAVSDYLPEAAAAERLQVCPVKDAETECRAAANWARARLQAAPGCRIGIVVTDLEARRRLLTPILDELFAPAALENGSDALPAAYNLSLGLPLLQHGLVSTAIALLRALAMPQGMLPDELGTLLLRPYWSADLSEADLRARIDAALRERPGQKLPLAAGVRIAHALAGADKPWLAKHLHALADAQTKVKSAQRPSEWAGQFREVLREADWPGERTLSSTEFQARATFLEVLERFARLDEVLGLLRVSAAVSELQRLCADKIFQPKTPGDPPLQVLGMLEASGAAFDVLWVMGMNDDRWPPPAHPNPLLPAELQRRHATPAASAEIQAAFARSLQADLLRTAPEIIFSYAEKEGDRELRPSPLMPGIAVSPAPTSTTEVPCVQPEFLDDALAPPVADDEQVSGGSSLLKAQALCPAWAFYRYRLGAKALQSPAEGLDAATRGTLVHATLEAFWQSIGSLATLQALGDDGDKLMPQLAAAVETALARLESELGEALTPTLRTLEANRLQRLCSEWLHAEGARPVSFTVQACEERHAVTLGRLKIHLVIDRIDLLAADGGRVVIDYKTGGKLDVKHWLKERILEPQLPLYAALVLAEPGQTEVAAVAFAKVRRGECSFVGLAAQEGLLPGVSAYADWGGLLGEWKARLLELADEIQRGEAAVRFEDERDLAYCEVLPLLRLAERRTQFEVAHD